MVAGVDGSNWAVEVELARIGNSKKFNEAEVASKDMLFFEIIDVLFMN
jgi:hypothetical protein